MHMHNDNAGCCKNKFSKVVSCFRIMRKFALFENFPLYGTYKFANFHTVMICDYLLQVE